MMGQPVQIGITGGIGSGKSIVCRIFQCLGVPVYDSDRRAKSLMTTDGILIALIKKEFGDLSFDEEGRLNRKYLADAVFSDETKLDRLNELVHPRVEEDYRIWVGDRRQHHYVLKEAALLFETGSYKGLDQVVVVISPEELRRRRVLARDPHRSSDQLDNIFSRQLSDDEKIRRASHVIRNDERTLLIKQVLSLHDVFLQFHREL